MRRETSSGCVLLIDDSEIVTEIAALTLESAGYFVERRATHDLSSRELRTIHPDVVVLDLGLPGLTDEGLPAWIAACRALCPEVRIVLHSGREPSELRSMAQRVGVEGYVSKNGRNEMLVTAVEAALSARS